MICKIQPANPDILAAVEYNERKTSGETLQEEEELGGDVEGIEKGKILATRNVPEGSTLTEEFETLRDMAEKNRKRGKKITDETFHMSVNPSATDRKLDDATAVILIDEIMSGLGYADQPYRIYRHDDTGRTHYHVVSSRIGKDGKKIKADFERLVLRRKLKELARNYGFELPLNEEETLQEMRKNEEREQRRTERAEKAGNDKNEKRNQTKDGKKRVPPFSRQSEEPIVEQFRNIFHDTESWHYSTFEQLRALMIRRYNVLIEVEKAGEEERIIMSGINSDGAPTTAPIREEDIGIKMLEVIKAKCEKERMRSRKEQRARLDNLAKLAAENSKTYGEFVKTMEKKGVYVVVSFTKDGEPFGVTWIDRATRCAWKGSETSRDIRWLKEEAAKHSWIIKEDKRDKVALKRSKMPSKKTEPAKQSKVTSYTPPESGVRRKGPISVKSPVGHSQAAHSDTGIKKDIFDKIAEEQREEEERKNALEQSQ